MPRKPTEPVQLKLRFSERLRARIEAAATKNNQSMNNEIIRRLEQSFERDERADLIQATATATATAIASHWGIAKWDESVWGPLPTSANATVVSSDAQSTNTEPGRGKKS